MRKVAILTPAYDCTVDVYYHHCVIDTIKLCAQHGIDVVPLSWPGEALVQHARNALTKIALNIPGLTDVVWIDSDQEWEPADFLKLLGHPVDVVGATYPKKTGNLPGLEREEYPVYVADGVILRDEERGLWQVDGLGTGFLRVSRAALQAVYQASEPYEKNGEEWRMVFNVPVLGGRLWGEDTVFCAGLVDQGYTIYLDPSFTVGHNGYKRYRGDFRKFVLGRTPVEEPIAAGAPD